MVAEGFAVSMSTPSAPSLSLSSLSSSFEESSESEPHDVSLVPQTPVLMFVFFATLCLVTLYVCVF